MLPALILFMVIVSVSSGSCNAGESEDGFTDMVVVVAPAAIVTGEDVRLA